VRFKLIAGFFWLFGLFALTCNLFPVFRLKTIEVEGHAGPRAEIERLLEESVGDNLLRLDLGGWAARIATLPGVARARTYVTLDGRAVAEIERERPVCLVDTDPVCGAAKDGMLLPLAGHPAIGGIPLVTGIGGKPVYYVRSRNPRLLTALQFFDRWELCIDKHKDRLAEIHVSEDSEVGIYLWPERRYITVGRGAWNDRLDDLWTLVKRLPATDRPLDFRFSGTVVERP
jgi:hypothetical protein